MQFKRWSPARKHAAVQMIREGKLDRATLMRNNQISEEEMREWERDAELGVSGHKRKKAYQARRMEA